MRRLYMIFVFLLTTFVAFSQKASVVAELDSIAIYIGQQAHLMVAVIAKESAEVQFPEFQPRQYLIPGVEILDISETDTVHMDNRRMKVSRCLTLTAFEDSLYAIPPIEVRVDDIIVASKPIALKVVTMEVDTLHLNQFFPPKDVQSNPFQWNEWLGLFRLSILMVLLCALGVYLSIRLKENKPIITRIRIIKKIPPHQRALKEIDKLKEEHLMSSEDQKTYYTRLTDTLRKYIEERFGFSAMEMTTSQIIYNLQQLGDHTMIAELEELFETADLVKFAKYSTLINENDLNLVNAISFIDQTKLEGQPTEERIVPQLSENDIKIKQSRRAIKLTLWFIVIGVVVLFVYIMYQLMMLL